MLSRGLQNMSYSELVHKEFRIDAFHSKPVEEDNMCLIIEK